MKGISFDLMGYSMGKCKLLTILAANAAAL
jgi:hypothetical protein